ncbi:hypothetical protein [Virgibacillus oceani]|uniref:Uncharacterized protein n=1 Tax=Virgibacillus oceani TaxID=1479511 RepID=A0A917HND7_9BACI|nr:hypothetical protein [Virgibacillus oceani]GGG85400.1 hypothetical protein GCM10011398_33940 [Virgibacillus oceani]
MEYIDDIEYLTLNKDGGYIMEYKWMNGNIFDNLKTTPKNNRNRTNFITAGGVKG